MAPSRFSVLFLTLIMTASILGCSDDDDNNVDPGVPDDPSIKTVLISPESATFSMLGEDQQFEAVAFDGSGAVVDTVFTWLSSDVNVVAIGADAMAVATGFGTTEIYAMASGVSDTATVTVTLEGIPGHEWIAAGSGVWSDPANWSDGAVPGEGEVAYIIAAGTYAVTLDDDVTVAGLVLGNDSGVQTLDTQSHQLITTTGGLTEGADLVVDGEFRVRGGFVWSGGTVSGTGTLEIESGAELNLVGNPLNLAANLNSSGTITLLPGSSFRVNNVLDSNSGALVELQGDAIMTVQNGGNFTSTGTILKSFGDEEASIFTSSADFSSTGSLLVDAGSLVISGGSLRGLLDIGGDAVLRQTGTTDIPNVNSQGDGPFVVGGRVNLGTYENQIITFRHLILDSAQLPSVTGPASLTIDHEFVWRQGAVQGLNALTTQTGSHTTFENGGLQILSATRWSNLGEVAGDSNVNLALASGANLSIENAGRWNQSSGGTISMGAGDPSSFDVSSRFNKTGEGAFTVKTPFNCAGILNLVEGALIVQGDFDLLESGVITGGGTADPVMNVRLILVDAPTAVMRGTIRPDLDGQPARFDIQGLVDLESTFRLELDAVTSGPFNTESVTFLTGGQELGGTLAITALAPPTAGVDYRVVSTIQGVGTFDAITGGEPFTEIIEDELGVLLKR